VATTIPRSYLCSDDPEFMAHLSLALRSGPTNAIVVEDGKPLPQ
jgi:hypothetical protein